MSIRSPGSIQLVQPQYGWVTEYVRLFKVTKRECMGEKCQAETQTQGGTNIHSDVLLSLTAGV